jgi:hypothetical protein
MAVDSGTGGLSSMDLLRLLGRDAEDGVFDGRGRDGALTLGTCKRECNLSGETLRPDFSDSMALFLSSPANHSSLAQGAVNDFLVRVATRQSDLFTANPNATYDVTPPTITVVENTAVDESGLTASVADNTIAEKIVLGLYSGKPVFQGDTKVVALNGTTIAMFSRYASHYGPTDEGIPKWRFLVADDRSDADNIDVEVRLVRDSDGVELLPWFKAPPVPGAGYNREVVVSSALHPDLGTLTGAYRLEVKATDEKGNVSPLSFGRWLQVVLPPPVRQRGASACDAATDSECAQHYSLSGNLDAAVPINGVGLPHGSLRVGHLYIDNPNSVAVRVRIDAIASADVSRGRKGWVYVFGPQVSFTAGCQPNQLPDGSCYAPPDGSEDLLSELSGLPVTVELLVGGAPIGACAGCAANEVEIPSGTSAEVWVRSGPFSFLWSSYPLGRLMNPNLPATAIGSAAESWVKWMPNGAGQIFPQSYWYLTRIAVTPRVRTTLLSRTADSRAQIAPAIGTNTDNFAATPSPWNTSAPGEPSF